jgi:hypothetical protein
MSNQSSNRNEYFGKRPLGFLISKKIELLALAAFSIALSTLIFQIKGCMQGPEVVLFPPDQIFILKDESYSDCKPRVRFGATMVYVNNGQLGNNGIIQIESIKFSIGNKKYQHNWDKFAEFNGSPGSIQINNIETAKPFTVSSGDSKSHQTFFIAWPKRCTEKDPQPCNVLENHAYWDDFISELKTRVKKGETKYLFEFETSVYNESPVRTSCIIQIDNNIIGAIEIHKQYSPTCFSD